MVALRASVGFTESNARGRKGWKGLEQHDHARARLAAVMATRWSRLRGELYLARKSGDGEVSDVEDTRWCCGWEQSDQGARWA